MAVNKSAAAAELGARLKRRRDDAALSTREMGSRIGVSAANISHWETGSRLIPLERLSAFLEECDVDADERESMLGLRRKAEGPGELAAGVSSVGASVAQLIEYEEAATRILHYELGVIPGLLQTSELARAIVGPVPDANVRVRLRVGRSEILTRKSNPVEFLALIDSEVLVRPIASPAVMARQYEHLLRMQELSNVTIRIVPSTVPGFHTGLLGSFKVFQFPSASPVVNIEDLAFLWDEEVVARYLKAAQEIEGIAMTPDHTSEAIRKMLRGLETT